jgi:hypothetical protein
MRPATPDQPDEGDELMGPYISEAGDPHVEPRPEHVAHVRSLLLERLGPPRTARRWRARLLVGSGLAAALAIVVGLLAIGRPVVAWAQVAKALQERPWIHGTVKDADGKVLFEQWLSSDRGRGGLRAGPVVAYHDYKRKAYAKYVPAEGAVYRLPEPPEGTPGDDNFLRQVFDELLDPKGPTKLLFPGSEVIGQTRREVEDAGKKWVEVEFTLRVAGGSRGGPESLRIRIDPATNLPVSMVMDDEDGKRYTASIDYPDRGPADLYDLGVPRTAKVIDRIPPDAVGRVLAGLKAGRHRFDDYCAFVVEDRVLPANYFPRVTVYRVWRKGLKWRIERLRPDQPDWAPPPDADTAWWKAHQGNFEFVPALICEGSAYWDYYLADGWKPGMPVPKPGTPTDLGQTVGPNQLSGPGDDPILPFWCQELLPEQAGHPTAGLDQPDHDREFLVESKPGGGPPGTILLRGRDTSPREAGVPDHFRLWVDPAANDLAMRAELRVADASDKTKVAFIATRLLEASATSPKGHRYPTRTRELTHNGQHEVARRFSLDFEAQIPDELFRPLK